MSVDGGKYSHRYSCFTFISRYFLPHIPMRVDVILDQSPHSRFLEPSDFTRDFSRTNIEVVFCGFKSHWCRLLKILCMFSFSFVSLLFRFSLARLLARSFPFIELSSTRKLIEPIGQFNSLLAGTRPRTGSCRFVSESA